MGGPWSSLVIGDEGCIISAQAPRRSLPITEDQGSDQVVGNFIKLQFAVTNEKRKMEPGKIIFINSRERQFMHRSKRNYKHG